MQLDTKEFVHYLDDLDMTRKQKEEYIETVWNIMEAFVDEVFGLHPVQQIRGKTPDCILQSPIKTIDSKLKPVNDQFNRIAVKAGAKN